MVEEINLIKECIEKIAEENGYELTNNVDSIVKAKHRFFGVENYKLCPCDRNGDRYCISKHCHEDIEKNGICHCSMYRKKQG